MAFSMYPTIDYQGSYCDMRMLASRKFDSLRANARAGWIKALFTGKWQMPSLSKRLAGRAILGQHSLGLRSVEIERIVGTESRARDFDADFNPRREHMRTRWARIAELELNQVTLPAVELIQVGDDYFVRDGHHRVSVARALGCSFIDAQVTRVEVGEPMKERKTDPAALRYAAGKYNGEID